MVDLLWHGRSTDAVNKSIWNWKDVLTTNEEKLGVLHIEESPAQFVMVDNSIGIFLQQLKGTTTSLKCGPQFHVKFFSYNTYILEITKCYGGLQSSCQENSSSHSHIIAFMEHIMEANDT